MISIRKLAAVDMFHNGTRFILSEFALGIALPLVLGAWSIRAGLGSQSVWETLVGAWLVGIAANYIPLLVYAVVIVKGGTVKEEGQPEMAHAKRYGMQQVMILVPLMVAVVALIQEHQPHGKT
ncbi:MAG TPA: hypothetical protein VLX61_09635 [Anaerolineales bacterium]|nr:hypothetical protein [Anaerolineales bacterium]